MPVKWERRSPGWYTSERGSIVRVYGTTPGWWWLPEYPRMDGGSGPYSTLAEAKRAAEV